MEFQDTIKINFIFTQYYLFIKRCYGKLYNHHHK
jgi:hypothetical protein